VESSLKIVDEGEIGYARQRLKNRVFTQLLAFFEEEADRKQITQSDLAHALQKDPGQLNRLLRHPSNLTLDTISDLLVALEAELETRVVRFAEHHPQNYVHPLLARIKGAPPLPAKVKVESRPIRDSDLARLRAKRSYTSRTEEPPRARVEEVV
jgi:hypothetical protein